MEQQDTTSESSDEALSCGDRKSTGDGKYTYMYTSSDFSSGITPISTERTPTEMDEVSDTHSSCKEEMQWSNKTHLEAVEEKSGINSSEETTPMGSERLAGSSEDATPRASGGLVGSSEETSPVISGRHDHSSEETTPVGSGRLVDSSEETTPVTSGRLVDGAEPRHKLCFTPPLNRPKDPTVDSIGIMQQWRRDGLICNTPLIPRNTRQTRSGISFEYFFGPSRMPPRVLPRLKSTGNIGEVLGQRKEMTRRKSPLKQITKKRKSACKSHRWHTGCRVAMERRRVQEDVVERRRERIEDDDWKLVGQFWHDIRLKQEKERKEDKVRRERERRILHELMGQKFKDTLPKNHHPY